MLLMEHKHLGELTAVAFFMHIMFCSFRQNFESETIKFSFLLEPFDIGVYIIVQDEKNYEPNYSYICYNYANYLSLLRFLKC